MLHRKSNMRLIDPRGRGATARLALVAVAATAALAIGLLGTGCQGEAADDQAAPAAEQAGDGQQAAEATDAGQEASYSFKTMVLGRYAEGDGELAGTPKYSYLEVTGSQPSEAIDGINAEMKQEAENAFAKQMTEEIYTNPTDEQMGQEFYETYTFGCSYLDGATMCIVHSEYTNRPQAAHGTPVTTSLTYDLAAGSVVTPAEVVGLSSDELGALAWSAVDGYLTENGDVFTSAAEAFPDAADKAIVPAEAVTYCLTPDGVVAVFQPYAIGSYAMGTPRLLVCDLNGNPASSTEEVEIKMLPGDGEQDAA